MFSDPKKVKDNKLSTRLNDYQQQKLVYVADVLSEHPSALFRKLAMLQIDELYERIQQEESITIERIVRSSSCAVEAILRPAKLPMSQIMQPYLA